jgi:thiol:disulfide interchange protein DsbD
VVVSFSPCVYPLLPITLSFIGVKGSVGRFKGLTLSLVYVSGLAVTYSLLGLLAALSGSLFGKIASHPASPFILGNVCIITGLSFLDVIQLPGMGLNLQNKIQRTGGSWSAFLLGLVSGLVAGPCTAPALGSILVYVASRQNILYGMTLLFVFAYGMGFTLILAGTFGAAISNSFKSEAWLTLTRKLGGFILIGLGEYFIFQSGRLVW